MKYFNKRLNLTAEPSYFILYHYSVMIDDDTNIIHQSLIEGSPDWEAVPEWVITAFKNRNGSIYSITPDGMYSWLDPSTRGGISAETLLAHVNEKTCAIHSVRRSDGVEFKIDDATNCGKIKRFELKEGLIYAWCAKDEKETWWDINVLQNAPAVLLTTIDGVEITDEDARLFWITPLDDIRDCYAKDPLIDSIKVFSTKEAAESYIAEIKPLYSLADIRKAWEKGNFIWFEVSNFIDVLKQVK